MLGHATFTSTEVYLQSDPTKNLQMLDDGQAPRLRPRTLLYGFWLRLGLPGQLRRSGTGGSDRCDPPIPTPGVARACKRLRGMCNHRL